MTLHLSVFQIQRSITPLLKRHNFKIKNFKNLMGHYAFLNYLEITRKKISIQTFRYLSIDISSLELFDFFLFKKQIKM